VEVGRQWTQSHAPSERQNVKEDHVITDPYRPTVGATSSNDAPFVVESSEELPAGSARFRVRETLGERNADNIEFSHVEAIHGVPKLRKRPC
jgi:hypothetical protein